MAPVIGVVVANGVPRYCGFLVSAFGEAMTRRPLVLTDGPAVGESVTARVLARGREECAFIDVDDVRQLVFAGGAAPWQGSDGREQQRLGVAHACALPRSSALPGARSSSRMY